MQFLFNLGINPPTDISSVETASMIFQGMMTIALFGFIASIIVVCVCKGNKVKPIAALILSIVLSIVGFIGNFLSYIEITKLTEPTLVQNETVILEVGKTYDIYDFAEYTNVTETSLHATSINYRGSSDEPEYEISEGRRQITILDGEGDVVIWILANHHDYSPYFQITARIVLAS